mmetsp:Transcript_51980/g.96192  ORF Transcript_51980/g.96192 Transcript_51980/m.96192 type:complete len:234 (-) Transcript_51980:2269-2970(-)
MPAHELSHNSAIGIRHGLLTATCPVQAPLHCRFKAVIAPLLTKSRSHAANGAQIRNEGWMRSIYAAVCAQVAQEFSCFSISIGPCSINRGAFFQVRGIKLGAGTHQSRGQLTMAKVRGAVERSLPCLIGNIGIGSHQQQVIDNSQVALLACQVQWCATLVILSIHISTGFDQRNQGTKVATACDLHCEVQGCAFMNIDCIHVGSHLNKLLNHLCLAASREVQDRLALACLLLQ